MISTLYFFSRYSSRLFTEVIRVPSAMLFQLQFWRPGKLKKILDDLIYPADFVGDDSEIFILHLDSSRERVRENIRILIDVKGFLIV